MKTKADAKRREIVFLLTVSVEEKNEQVNEEKEAAADRLEESQPPVALLLPGST